LNGSPRYFRHLFSLIHISQNCTSHLQFVTLVPGDLIFTGTPPGVGCFRKPPLWLKVAPPSLCNNISQVGDVVECEIEGIGAITNTVTAEPAQ
jgi:2-keto-4-pentenoate hydratase/2-oxohepta-3-ene-1,7-dioic acid hydratase in catechol pathway